MEKTSQPDLITSRLRLRPFTLADAPDVHRLASDCGIAATTLAIPYPYPDGAAEAWISTHAEAFEKGESVMFAVTLRSNGELVGAVSLGFNQDFESAEMGYWIGVPFWGKGYCTEAARAMMDYGFRLRGVNRIWARHFATNPASGRVMEKIGMQFEGTMREGIKKWGEFVDVRFYGLIRREYPF